MSASNNSLLLKLDVLLLDVGSVLHSIKLQCSQVATECTLTSTASNMFVLNSCWLAWKQQAALTRALQASFQRVLQRRSARLLANAMAAWQGWVVEMRLSVRSIVRLSRRYLAKAMLAWRLAIEQRQVHERIIARAHIRRHRRYLRQAMAQWQAAVLTAAPVDTEQQDPNTSAPARPPHKATLVCHK